MAVVSRQCLISAQHASKLGINTSVDLTVEGEEITDDKLKAFLPLALQFLQARAQFLLSYSVSDGKLKRASTNKLQGRNIVELQEDVWKAKEALAKAAQEHGIRLLMP